MIRTDRAVCVGLDRPSQRCLVQFLTVGETQPEAVPVPYVNQPPWPLAFVTLAEVASGSYLCLGGRGDCETRMVDDFDQVWDMTPALVAGTVWETVASTSASAVGELTSATAAEYGTIRLTTGGTTDDEIGLRKEGVNLVAPPALWYEGKFTFASTSDVECKLGFVDGDADSLWSTDDQVIARGFPLSSGLEIAAKSGGSETTVNTGYVPTAGQPFYVNLIVSGGAFAALWIIDDPAPDDEYTVQGPFIVESNVPESGLGAGFSVRQSAGTAKSIDCDFVRVHTVWPIASPQDLVSGAG